MLMDGVEDCEIVWMGENQHDLEQPKYALQKSRQTVQIC